MKVCEIEGCQKKYYGRGFCSVHYMRWWKHGDPFIVKDGTGVRNTLDDFWGKVDKRGEGECWEWKAAKDKDGYGIYHRLKTIKAHRFVTQYIMGLDIEGLVVCHNCDNPPCVNPDHLFLGTIKNNSDDMVAKSRQVRGSRQHKAKFTNEEVGIIRRLHMGGISIPVLTETYGVTRKTMYNLVHEISYANVEWCDI